MIGLRSKATRISNMSALVLKMDRQADNQDVHDLGMVFSKLNCSFNNQYILCIQYTLRWLVGYINVNKI